MLKIEFCVLFSIYELHVHKIKKANVVQHCLYSYRQQYLSLQWSKCCVLMRRSQDSPQQILAIVIMNIIVEPHSVCFFHNI